MQDERNLLVFSGNANRPLAAAVCKELGVRQGKALVSTFSDGEVQVEIEENVRRQEVFVVQPTNAPTAENFMELLVLIDALKRASAASVTAVVPYFGYARQDRRPRSSRVPITAKVAAKMFGAVGTDRVLTVDQYPPCGEKVAVTGLSVLAGGQAATAMVACRAFGLARVRYVGKVGDDDFGRRQTASLDEAGVDRALVREEPGVPSQWADIVVDGASGERTIFWQRDSRLNFRAGELDDEALLDAPVLLLDGYDTANAARVAKKARARGILTVTDIDHFFPGMEELLPCIDVCISSESFPHEFSGEGDLERALRAVARLCPGIVGATRGVRGVAVLGAGGVETCPAYPVRAVDTTGAGDVFHGGLVYGLTRGWPLCRTLRFAQAAAAVNCLKPGARGNLRPAAEVETFARGG